VARLTALPPPEDKARAVRSMFDAIAPRYDRLNRIMTFGLDVAWRRATVAMLNLPRGSVVLDLACGTGDLCRELQRAGQRPVGFDVSAGMLQNARTSAPLVQADILRLPLADGSADGLTCGFALRNVIDLHALFAECARVVRRGGRIGLLEVAEPDSALLRRGHDLYFRKWVPFIGGLLSDKQAYSYLPASTAYLPEPAKLLAMVADAGFDEVRRRVYGFGAAQLITATRR